MFPVSHYINNDSFIDSQFQHSFINDGMISATFFYLENLIRVKGSKFKIFMTMIDELTTMSSYQDRIAD